MVHLGTFPGGYNTMYADPYELYGYEEQGTRHGYELMRAVALGSHDLVKSLLVLPELDVNGLATREIMWSAITGDDTEEILLATLGISASAWVMNQRSRCLAAKDGDGSYVNVVGSLQHNVLCTRPLEIAVASRNVAICALLLTHPSINVNCVTVLGSPLVMSIMGKEDNEVAITRMLKSHPDYDAGNYGYDIFYQSWVEYHICVPICEEKSECMALWNEMRHSCAKGDLEAVRRLMVSSPQGLFYLTSNYSYRAAPYLRAVENGHESIVEYLMENLTRKQKNKALHVAARLGHTSLVTLLLDHGADINVRDKEGRTALASLCNSIGASDGEMYEKNLIAIHRLLTIQPKRKDRKDMLRLDCTDAAGKTVFDTAPPPLAYLIKKHRVVHRELRGLAEIVLFEGVGTKRLLPQLPPDLERHIATYLLPTKPAGIVATTLEAAIDEAKEANKFTVPRGTEEEEFDMP